MTELIERYQDYAARTPGRKVSGANAGQGPAHGLSGPADAAGEAGAGTIRDNQQTWGRNDTLRSEWIFETVRSSKGAGSGTVMGSYRSLAQFSLRMREQQGIAMPPGMVPDPDELFDEEAEDEGSGEAEVEGLAAIEEGEDSAYDTDGATKGSGDDPFVLGPGRLGMNDAAAHSTVVIRRQPSAHGTFGGSGDWKDDPTDPARVDITDASVAVRDADVEADADRLVAALGAPPAYENDAQTRTPATIQTQLQQTTRSSHSTSPPPSPTTGRRASYAARSSTAGRGTALRAVDLGNGVDTIRPVKRVDAAGSLRLSAEYVGAIREARDDGGTVNSVGGPGSLENTGKGHKKKGSDMARTGKMMVDDVIVPVVQNVSSFFLHRVHNSLNILVWASPSMMGWMLEKLSH